MRVIVYGTGAIGGAVAAALVRAGQDVTAIARGAQLEAIRARGLRLRSPNMDETVPLDVVDSPEAANIGPGDAVLLTMKGQDTQAALEDLRAAGVTDQPIFCLQNGVSNEAKALRLFPNVHGVTVMMPAIFVKPGEVAVQSQPKLGLYYVGRYPQGVDAADEALVTMLNDAGIAAMTKPEVMAPKYGKLLLNLGNIVGAALGRSEPANEIGRMVRREGEAVLRAAAIRWEDVGDDHPDRVRYMQYAKVPGVENIGTSTTQSLVRRTGGVETDWLNGEIALLGRMHGVPVPANGYFTGLAARMAREGLAPGSIDPDAVRAGIAELEG